MKVELTKNKASQVRELEKERGKSGETQAQILKRIEAKQDLILELLQKFMSQ